jgi:hypothetical protein
MSYVVVNVTNCQRRCRGQDIQGERQRASKPDASIRHTPSVADRVRHLAVLDDAGA